MPFTIKMLKEMFLQTSLNSQIFSVVTFIIVPTISEIICGTTHILHRLRQVLFYFHLHVKRYIKHLSLQSKPWLNLCDVWVTVAVNVSVSDRLRHTWHLLPLHIHILALGVWSIPQSIERFGLTRRVLECDPY